MFFHLIFPRHFISIDSIVKLYADEVLLFRTIDTPNNHQVLQSDLTKLAPNKCYLVLLNGGLSKLLISHAHPLIHHYKIKDYTIKKSSLLIILASPYLKIYHGQNTFLELLTKQTLFKMVQ